MSEKLPTVWITCLTCDGYGKIMHCGATHQTCHDCLGEGGHFEIEEVPAVRSGFAQGLAQIAASILF